jgi:hypothetical protein
VIVMVGSAASHMKSESTPNFVIPAQAGIHPIEVNR